LLSATLTAAVKVALVSAKLNAIHTNQTISFFFFFFFYWGDCLIYSKSMYPRVAGQYQQDLRLLSTGNLTVTNAVVSDVTFKAAIKLKLLGASFSLLHNNPG
jgi:cytochrome bd-type quinol oxidase subunit 2